MIVFRLVEIIRLVDDFCLVFDMFRVFNTTVFTNPVDDEMWFQKYVFIKLTSPTVGVALESIFVANLVICLCLVILCVCIS